MYSLELNLRYSPFPISIQRREYNDVKCLYDEIRDSISGDRDDSDLIELKWEKVQDKLISVQIYEKSSVAGGSKRPGFSLDI